MKGLAHGMGSLLAVDDIVFDYRDKPVLHGITFKVERGSLCGLLGPNASGKTTLLKCINGVLKPRQGHVRVNGENVGAMTRREVARLMAVVPQQMSLAFSFTALQMVVMGRASRLGALSLPSSKDRDEARAAMEELGVEDLAERQFNELSGGERQLALLARAIFQETPLLLLDEPTSHLDFRNQYRIMDVVSEMTRAKGLSTLVTLHDPNLAARYCTHLVLLREGRLHRSGTREAVFERKTLEEVYGMEVFVQPIPGGPSMVLPGRGVAAP
ncbi:MAG: ABC transporter ATP-binding protein [Geobacteraceae bacterium]|nr:ABC transporter ATP-binding protein [Geobacteraceae bacterium]